MYVCVSTHAGLYVAYNMYISFSHIFNKWKLLFFFMSSNFSVTPFTHEQSIMYKISWLVAAAAAKPLQLCPTLCDTMDGSPPCFPVPRTLQARTLEWVATSFSNAWKWKVKVKTFSRIWLLETAWTAAYQAPPSMGFSRQEYWSGFPLFLAGKKSLSLRNQLYLCYNGIRKTL